MHSVSFSEKDNRYFKMTLKILKRSLKIKKKYIKYLVGRNKKINYDVGFRAAFYPSGKGFYQRHTDKEGKELIIDIISLSQHGTDYFSGGLSILHKTKKINIDKRLELGDMVFFNPTVSHAINKIDKNKKMLNGDFFKNGRFSIITAMMKKST